MYIFIYILYIYIHMYEFIYMNMYICIHTLIQRQLAIIRARKIASWCFGANWGLFRIRRCVAEEDKTETGEGEREKRGWRRRETQVLSNGEI